MNTSSASLESAEHESENKNTYQSPMSFRHKVILTVTIVAVVSIIVMFFVSTLSIIPLIFISILLAIMLRSLARPLMNILSIEGRWVVLLVAFLLVVSVGGFFIVTGPSIVEQFDQLTTRIPEALGRLEETIRQYDWGATMLENLGQVAPPNFGNVDFFSRLTGLFSSAFGTLTNITLVTVAGIYMAFNPGLYVNNLIRLFPLDYRDRAEDVLNEGYEIIQRWLIARLLSMIVVGVFTLIGLIIIDMPLALTLAVIAGLFSFIPNIGPILSSIPAILVGLTQSLVLAGLAVVVYVIVQLTENYLITPSIQRQTVSLPPALVMLSQVFLALLFGWVGLFIAAPLVAFSIVLVKSIYVEDFLGDRVGRILEDKS